jgi:anti-sigma regulatory factor (Ser/Thr protein kinase)
VPTSSRSLPAEVASVPAARHFVRDALAELGLSTAWDTAELLVSELVTNAVLHARTEFRVEVRVAGDMVRIAVQDASAMIPRPRTYGTDSTTGRGLRLIATIAEAWGVQPEAGGKAVWFEVRADGTPGRTTELWGPEDPAHVETLFAAFQDDEQGPTSAAAPNEPPARESVKAA